MYIKKIRKKIKVDTQMHSQKLSFFVLYPKLSYSKYETDLQNTQIQTKNQILKKLKTQTQTQT